MVSFHKAGNITVKCLQGTGIERGELGVNFSRRGKFSPGALHTYLTERKKGCIFQTHTPPLHNILKLRTVSNLVDDQVKFQDLRAGCESVTQFDSVAP